MFFPHAHNSHRTGGVYIAVLGSALIVSVLGLAALTMQMLQNRILSAAADIRQAQLNAEAAVELGRLMIEQDPDWRTNRTNGRWFTDRATGPAGFGTCSLDVIDPLDGDLANNPDDPVLLRGIGHRGDAEQRVELWLEPRRQPLDCLRTAIAVGNAAGMPDWDTVFDHYQTNGTELNINSLPTSTPNRGRNPGIENPVDTNDPNWTGAPPGAPTARVDRSSNYARSGTFSLRTRDRATWQAGAAQRIDAYVKPGQAYNIEVWIMLPMLSITREFRISLHTKGTGDSVAPAPTYADTTVVNLLSLLWTKASATLTAPSWSGDLEYAYIKVAGANSLNTGEFYLDDFGIWEPTTGRFIFRKVLSPNVNQLYAGAPTDPDGIYWINCNGNRLIIESSRILGTLLLVNPGAGSQITHGPVHWAPARAGYPALLVDGNFAIRTTRRGLGELENGTNYHFAAAAGSEFNSSDTTGVLTDIYPSEIRGLVAVSGDLTRANSPLIRGQVIVGGSIVNAGGTLEVEYGPESLLNPPPGFRGPDSHEPRPGSTRRVAAD